MNTKAKNKISNADKLKWALTSVLMVSGIVASSYFRDIDGAIKWAVGIVLVGFIAVVSLWTTQGKVFGIFLREAKTELRRVVWPSRQETLRTTLLVAVIVVIMACLLWGMDSLLASLVTWWGG